MNKPSGEVCDYCNIRYPDRRSLLVHQIIHVDKDMDSYLTSSGIIGKSHLPRARQLLPNGIRNNRSFEINYRKVVMNVPLYGKQYSKVFHVSEAIEELLHLCKKYPLRESADPAFEKLPKCDETPFAEKVPVSLSLPPNYSELASVCYSNVEATSILRSESISGASEPDRNEAQNKVTIAYEDEQNIKISPGQIRDSSPDSGYGSPPQAPYPEFVDKDSKNPFECIDSQSVIQIKDLMNNLVSKVAIVSDNHLKISDRTAFNPDIEISAPDMCAMQKNVTFDFQSSDKLCFESFVPLDENMIDENHQTQNVSDIVFSMPQIIY